MISLAKIAIAVGVAAGLAYGSMFGAAAAPLKLIERKIVDKKPTYEIKFSYPQTGNVAIDREIEAWAKGVARDFVSAVEEDHPKQEPAYSGEISYEVVRNDAAMFSVLFTYYTYTGGAHPNSNFTAFNFALPGGASVEIGELFTNAGIERISRIAINSIRRDIGGPDGMSDTDWIAKGAGANGSNFRNFILKPRELALYFDAYQVAAYAAGPQEVHIPLARIKSFMRPYPLTPSASFDCAKASTDVEQAICSTRELARLDRHVADKYFDALTWAVDAPARAKIRNDQRIWLNARDTHCQVAAQAFVACLMTSYQARLQALAIR